MLILPQLPYPIVILLFAPFYSLCSAMSIWFQDTTGYIDMIRDFYEALLIYKFYSLLMSYIAYDPILKETNHERLIKIMASKGIQHHMWPMNWILKDKPIRLISEQRAEWFYTECTRGVLQFIPCNFMCTFISILASINQRAFVEDIMAFILFFSTSISLYYLVLFYHVMMKELSPYKPLLKFLSIKSVLFFTYWQKLVITYIIGGIIRRSLYNSGCNDEQVEITELELLSLLETFEMVLLAIMTAIAFSLKDFMYTESIQPFFSETNVRLAGQNFKEVLVTNIKDTIKDIELQFTQPLTRERFEYKRGRSEYKDIESKHGDMNNQSEDQPQVVLYDKIMIIPDNIKTVKEEEVNKFVSKKQKVLKGEFVRMERLR